MKCTVQELKYPVKKFRPYICIYIYIYDVEFLALLGASYIYDISSLRVKTKNVNILGDGNPSVLWHSKKTLMSIIRQA
jgi:hypothetical protein